MLAAVVVRLGSAASAVAVVLLVAVVLRVPAALRVPAVLRVVLLLPVPYEPEPQLPALAPPGPVQVPPEPLLNLLSLRLPQVAVESEVRVRLQGRRSFSAAMARSSPLTAKPT